MSLRIWSVVIAALVFCVSTAGADTVATNWKTVDVTIDGTIDSAEWADAYPLEVEGSYPFTVYFKSDDQYLYLAYDVEWDDSFENGDGVGIYFDNDNDGSYPADCGDSDEGRYYMNYNSSGMINGYQTFSTGGSCGLHSTTAVTSAAAFAAKGNPQFEARIDLTLGEIYGAPGDAIGFIVYTRDEDSGLVQSWNTSSASPAFWADLIYSRDPDRVLSPAWASQPPKIDGLIGEDEWDDYLVQTNSDGLAYDLYMMADERYLYFAYDVTGDAVHNSLDQILWNVDNDNDDAWPAACGDEGSYFFMWDTIEDFNAWFMGAVVSNPPFCDWETPTSITLASSLNGNMQYEVMVALDEEITGGPGETIGLYTAVHDDAADFANAYWPSDVVNQPADYGDLDFPELQAPQMTIVSMPAASAPTIDGALDTIWQNATRFSVYGALPYDVYLMSIGHYLYGAIVAVGDPTLDDGDTIYLSFDNENDDLWSTTCPGATDGTYTINRSTGGGLHTAYQSFYGSWQGCALVQYPEPLDAVIGGDDPVVYEFKIDLTGGQMYGAPEETVGLWFYARDNATKGAQQTWPYTAQTGMYPAEFAEFTFPACDGCEIDDVCYSDGETAPDNVCLICDIDVSTTAWAYNNGVSCEDNGLYCDGEEVCDQGSCDHINAPCGDNGDFCDGEESCDEDNDLCLSSGDPCTDDGLWCNGEESCDEDNDQCLHEYTLDDPRCPDNELYCDGEESCDEDNDQCLHEYTLDDPRCPDNELYCDGEESCDEDNDQCVSSGDPCEEGEVCIEATDECVSGDDDTTDDDTVDDDTVDDDTVDDDTVDDDTVDDDTVDDDTTDDDTVDDDTVDDDTVDDDTDDDDDDDDDIDDDGSTDDDDDDAVDDDATDDDDDDDDATGDDDDSGSGSGGGGGGGGGGCS